MSEARAPHGRDVGVKDLPAARDLLMASLDGTTLAGSAMHALTRAAAGGDREHRGVAAPRAGRITALALYGHVAGASGAARLVAVVWHEDARETATALLTDVCDAARLEGARFLMAELPNERGLFPMIQLLLENGFVEEARIPDFVRDGVALRFLRWSSDS